jgi:uncharacterized protein (TIGR00255 family)
MTGFGKANSVYETKKVSIEIRSLNSKSLDLNLKVASCYKDLEPEIRKIVSERLIRGKIDVGVYLESEGSSDAGIINVELAQHYFNQIKLLNDKLGNVQTDFLSHVLRMPEVISNQSKAISEEENNWVLEILEQTCQSLIDFRIQEGQSLKVDLQEKIGSIKNLLNQISQYESERILTVKERIQKGLQDLNHSALDQNRLEQEMIFYIEKMDVSEEKMRLANHLDYFLETMKLPFSGKKLGFIAQEIGREINTLGSKSNHVEMQKLVVEMKDNLEKIKEQVLNTL